MQNPPPPPPTGGYPPPPPPPPEMQPPGAGMQYGAQPPMAYAQQAKYGGFWIRVVAYIIDGIILGIVGTIIDVIFRANPNDPNSTGYTIAQLINFLIGAGYFIGFWTAWSASPGQRVLKLRVVDANTTQPITVGKAVLRYIGLIVSFLVCFIGVIWVAFDARKQGWMDKIAGTVVLQG
jgi:uncharacterized RDD family membrane protein YckC